jgi:hypothetical protein
MSSLVLCQVRGCGEYALPYGIEIEIDDVEIELRLCRRHERAAVGSQPLAQDDEQQAQS